MDDHKAVDIHAGMSSYEIAGLFVREIIDKLDINNSPPTQEWWREFNELVKLAHRPSPPLTYRNIRNTTLTFKPGGIDVTIYIDWSQFEGWTDERIDRFFSGIASQISVRRDNELRRREPVRRSR